MDVVLRHQLLRQQKKKAGEWIYKGQRNLSCTIEAESGENVD